MWPRAGNLAVNVFFALSGWLIGGMLLRMAPRDLPRFYFNRCLRIWLPYLATVFLLYAIAAVFGRLGNIWHQVLFYDLTFTHYWFIPALPEVWNQMPLTGTGGHLWSISVEEQFYVLAPMVLLLLPFGKSAISWLLLSVALIAADYYYGSISCGVLAAILRGRFGNWQSGTITRALLAVGALLLLWVAFEHDSMYQWVAPFASIGIVLATSIEGARSALGKFAGGVSYPLYLNHWLGIFGANGIGKHFVLPYWAHVSLAYVLAILVSAIAYIAIDVRVLRFRKTHYTPAVGRFLMLTAYCLLAIGVLGGMFYFDRISGVH